MSTIVYQFKESGKKFYAYDFEFSKGKAYHIGDMEGEDGNLYGSYFSVDEMNRMIENGEVKRVS